MKLKEIWLACCYLLEKVWRSFLLISKVLIVKKQSVWTGVLYFTWRSFLFAIANLYFVDGLEIVFDVINSYFVSFFIHKYGKTSYSRTSSHKSMTYKFITIIFKYCIRISQNVIYLYTNETYDMLSLDFTCPIIFDSLIKKDAPFWILIIIKKECLS